jgi:ketosteroid isomerase-like protein
VEIVLGLQHPAADVDLAQLFRDDAMWAAFAEAVGPLFHPHCESVFSGVPGGGKTYTGVEGIRARWLDWLAPWATYRGEIEEAIDLGERVLVPGHAFGCLEGSAAEVKLTTGNVWTVRDGKIARVEFYIDRADALKAVGLAE